MSKKPPNASRPLESPEIDDLKLINGIGPAVESRLHRVGIFTFAQLAALSPADIAASVADLSGLSAERIIKQDWIGQAHKLALRSTSTGIPRYEGISREHLRNATFTVELLLDEHNEVNSTHIVHRQSSDEKSWEGWQEAELVGFLVQHAGLNQPSTELIQSKVAEIEPAAPLAIESVSVSHVTAETGPVSPVVTKPAPVGVLRIREMEIVKADNHGSHSFLRHSEPFQVQFTLDFAGALVPANTLLTYTASIYAKRLGGPKRQTVSEVRGTVWPTEKIAINVQNMTLPLGLYRLEAVVSLASKEPAQHPKLIAGIVGGLVQVY